MKITLLTSNKVCAFAGIIGSAIAGAFGGWTASITTLLIMMSADYISGLIVAGVFHKSTKTETGCLESKAGWKGICRKGMVLFFVLIGHRLDLAIGASYVRDAICIAYIANEFISLAENAGLMGVYVPPVIMNAIDVLKKRGDSKNENK